MIPYANNLDPEETLIKSASLQDGFWYHRQEEMYRFGRHISSAHRRKYINYALCRWYKTEAGRLLGDELEKYMAATARRADRRKNWKKGKSGDASRRGSQVMELVVLGAGGRGQTRSLLLAADKQSYLFNCGEGTQRSLEAFKFQVEDIKNVMVTYKSWENIGGLLGTLLTVKKKFGSTVNIHGPPGVENIVLLGKDFTEERLTKIARADLEAGRYSDSQIEVEYVQLETQYHYDKNDNWKLQEGTEKGKTEAVANENSRTEKPDISVVYICKAADSGVAAEDRSKSVVVLEVPNEGFLEPLMSDPRLQELAEQKPGVDVIVHMSCRSIVSHTTYREFIDRYSTDVKHIFLNKDCPKMVREPVCRLQVCLNLIDPYNYPLLPAIENPQPYQVTSDSMVTPPAGFKYRLAPSSESNWDLCARIDKARLLHIAEGVPGFLEALETFHKETKSSSPRPEGREYPEVVFLGTASTKAKTYRNVPCILVHTSPVDTVVLDCGEDSIGQLLRFYGDEADEVLRKIKVVFISHYHPDHFLGLINMVEHREAALKKAGAKYEKLHVAIPFRFRKWFDFYINEISPAFFGSIRRMPMDLFAQGHFEENIQPLGIKMLPVEVDHCPFAYGMVIEHHTGWKLVYSGDTRPCNNLVEAGMDCDLLIHEATFARPVPPEISHSTTEEAVNVAKRMRAKFTLLTHFAQFPLRLMDKLPSDVGFAFDNMKVTLSDVQTVPLHVGPLKVLLQRVLDGSFARIPMTEPKRQAMKS